MGTKAQRSAKIVAAVVLIASSAACGRGGDASPPAQSGGDAVAQGPGFDGTTIRIGSLGALTGPVAVVGEPFVAGNKLFFDQLNASGGIAGKYKVEIVTEDTQFDPAVTVQKYGKVKNDVVGFSHIIGTAGVKALVPQLKTDNIIAVPGTLDSDWVNVPNLLPVGASYQIQFINAADHYVNNVGSAGDTICFMGQEGPFGDAGLAGVEYAGDKLGFPVAKTARFKVSDQDYVAPVTQLRSAGCKAVFLTSTPGNTAGIVGTAAKLGFSPTWIGQSPSWASALAQSPLKPVLEASFIVSGEGPAWGDESVPGMKALLAAVEQFDPQRKPDQWYQFGYASGMAMKALLEKAVSNGDMSRDGVAMAAAELGEVDFQGLTGKYVYGPVDKRMPTRESSLFKVDASKPIGLSILEQSFSTDAAESFDFSG